VYQKALTAGVRVYEVSKRFPSEERYALSDQIRRSSRSVCANIAKASCAEKETSLIVCG
jgi:four helix bundle protein